MFSSSFAYLDFLEHWCYRCTHYVPYTEETTEHPCCPIEAGLDKATIDRREWPGDALEELPIPSPTWQYRCKQFTAGEDTGS